MFDLYLFYLVVFFFTWKLLVELIDFISVSSGGSLFVLILVGALLLGLLMSVPDQAMLFLLD